MKPNKESTETKEGPDGWQIRGNTLHGCLGAVSCLELLSLDPGNNLVNGGNRLKPAGYGKDAEVMGVELQNDRQEEASAGSHATFWSSCLTSERCSRRSQRPRPAVRRQLQGTQASNRPARRISLSVSVQELPEDHVLTRCVTVVAAPGHVPRVITDDPDRLRGWHGRTP